MPLGGYINMRRMSPLSRRMHTSAMAFSSKPKEVPRGGNQECCSYVREDNAQEPERGKNIPVFEDHKIHQYARNQERERAVALQHLRDE